MNTEFEEESEELEINEDQELDLSPNERKIVWQAKDITIRQFLDMKVDGDLILQPEYQRNFVATEQIASRLIESILLDVPIPVIYLAEEQNGNYSVIDGQQRLTSFISFIEGHYPDAERTTFKLKGLNVLPELNKKAFKDLEPDQQKKIRNTTIHSVLIKKESNDDIKFEIFERLNTGSTKLNEDEVRNTVYRGPYINLLSTLSDNQVFHSLVRKDNFKKRMIYRGMVLRFFALSEKSYLNYKSSMKQFCNKELRERQFLSKDKSKEFQERFLHCLDLVKVVFGDNAFRRYIPGPDGNSGYWSTGQINMALFDLQMVGFVNYSKTQVLSNADAIRDELLNLMITDKEFQNLIGFKTSDADNVKKRFKVYFDMLDKIITDSSYQKRMFPFSVKEALFKSNPICAISNQRILAIEDSEVDHILPFSKGGKTEVENAQLVLRYFNRKKGDRLDEY
jgi:hypothetical protein